MNTTVHDIVTYWTATLCDQRGYQLKSWTKDCFNLEESCQLRSPTRTVLASLPPLQLYFLQHSCAGASILLLSKGWMAQKVISEPNTCVTDVIWYLTIISILCNPCLAREIKLYFVASWLGVTHGMELVALKYELLLAKTTWKQHSWSFLNWPYWYSFLHPLSHLNPDDLSLQCLALNSINKTKTAAKTTYILREAIP